MQRTSYKYDPFLFLMAVNFLGAGDGLEEGRGTKGKSDSGTGLVIRKLYKFRSLLAVETYK